MLIATVIFLPIVLAYTAWVYKRAVGQGRRRHHRERRNDGLLSENGDKTMWYFSWVLGLGLACTVGILNAMWYELRLVRERDEGGAPPMRTP